LKVRGVRGAMVSYIGMIFPAFLLMLAFSFVYSRMHELPAVVSTFSGLQAVIVAVVANATLSFGKTSLKGWKSGLIAHTAAGLFGRLRTPTDIFPAIDIPVVSAVWVYNGLSAQWDEEPNHAFPPP